MTAPADQIRSDEIGRRLRDRDAIDEALRQGVADAIREHYVAGVPIAVWRDEKVVLLTPEDMEREGLVTSPRAKAAS